MESRLHPLSHQTYRPDIDGLRAIAILSVLFYHAFPGALPGGFVGVDIFFVISGFLISGIILEDVKNNCFKYSTFYKRRATRIFPALALVLGATLFAGWLCLFPKEWIALSKQVIAGAGFISNIKLMREGGGYFSSTQKPLLHLWSLGIEEQFYFLWPLFLGSMRGHWRRTFIAIIGVFAASFSLNILFVHSSPAVAFYFPAMRFWELAAGAFLAHLISRHNQGAKEVVGRNLDEHPWISSVLSLAGITLIVIAILTISSQRPFPGFWALLPVCGAACVIAAGPKSFLNKVFLGSGPMVFIGIISYPLYLWHWPLLVFTKMVVPPSYDKVGICAALLAALLLAYLTYRFVELPVRTRRTKAAVAWAMTGAVAAAGLLGVVGLRLGPKPENAKNGVIVEETEDDWNYPFALNFGKLDGFQTGKVEGKAGAAVMFVGDSHAEQYYARVKALAEQNSRDFRTTIFATYGGCPPLPKVTRGPSQWSNNYACDRFFDFAMSRASEPDVDTVVFAAFWENYFGYAQGGDKTTELFYPGSSKFGSGDSLSLADNAFSDFAATLRSLKAEGKRTFVILSNPESDLFDPNQMVSRLTGRRTQRDYERSNFDFAKPLLDRVRAAALEGGAEIIDPAEFLCGKVVCKTTDNYGHAIYKDADHYRASFAAQHVTFIDQVYSANQH